MMKLTKEGLTKLLKEAEKAHAIYEEQLGRKDEAWPSWYAEFIMNKIDENEN